MSRVMIMAGGTGGHVMPALSVARALRARGVDVLWLGTADGIEAKIVPRAGIEFRTISIKGVRQSGVMRWLLLPPRLLWSMCQAWWVMATRRIDCALGMGGFVSGPGGLVAMLLKKPLVIHEQNAVVGLTNRHLARFAKRILSGFPEADGFDSFDWVGNPVRCEIADLPPPQTRLGVARDAGLRVLIVGGSRGARVFNEQMPKLLATALPKPPLVWHQCGAGNAPKGAVIAERYLAAGIGCQVNDFIEDMVSAYQWCDVMICRAGAMTVAEVCAAGVAAIFVPYPHAVNDHQTQNAQHLISHRAALLVEQSQFIQGDWLKKLRALDEDRARIVKLADGARKFARNDAADTVAGICEQVCVEAVVAKSTKSAKHSKSANQSTHKSNPSSDSTVSTVSNQSNQSNTPNDSNQSNQSNPSKRENKNA